MQLSHYEFSCKSIYLSQFISNHLMSNHSTETILAPFPFLFSFKSLGHFYPPLTVGRSLPLRLLQGLLPHSTSPCPGSNVISLQRPQLTTLPKTAIPIILSFNAALFFFTALTWTSVYIIYLVIYLPSLTPLEYQFSESRNLFHSLIYSQSLERSLAHSSHLVHIFVE